MKLTPFGETVRVLRMRHDVSMKSMAEAMGISSSYLSGIEYGEKTLADKYVDAAIEFFSAVATDEELQGLRGTFFRQTQFAEFELAAHREIVRNFPAALLVLVPAGIWLVLLLIPAEVMAKLRRTPYFTRAWEPDGMTVEEFDRIPALLSTMKQFQAAMDKIVAFSAQALGAVQENAQPA